MNQFRINIKYEIILQLIEKEDYGRNIAKKLKIPLTTVQRNLNELVDSTVLDVKREGKNKIYSLKRHIRPRNHIFNAENYKLIKLISKHPFLESIFEQVINESQSSLIILFGSFAKFTPKQDSDIDIFIETEEKNIKEKLESYNSRIGIKIGLFNIDSLLIKEVISDHIIIKGVEEFYDRIKFFKKT